MVRESNAVAAGLRCLVAALGTQIYAIREISAGFLNLSTFLVGIGAVLTLAIVFEDAGIIISQKFRVQLALSPSNSVNR